MTLRAQRRRPASPNTTPPPGVDPETGEITEELGKALVLLKDVQELAQLQEDLLEDRFSGQAATEAYLYAYPEEISGRRTGVYVIGPRADFSLQMARWLNESSRGRVKLRLIPQAPVVQDFAFPGTDGRPRQMVRVIVGVIDEVSGETSFGIKTVPRVGMDPEGNAHTRAIRRAYELHPIYNRKNITRFIRTMLKAQGYDPKKFKVAGESGDSTWAEFFGRARAVGMDADQLRTGVRDQLGKGFSEVSTPAEAGTAAAAADQTIAAAIQPEELGRSGEAVERSRPAAAPSKASPPADAVDREGRTVQPQVTPSGARQGDPGVEDARQPLARPEPSLPTMPLVPTPEHQRRGQLLEQCGRIAEAIGLSQETKTRIWSKVGSRKATVNDLKQMKSVLDLMSTGTSEADAIKEVTEVIPF